MGGAQSAQVGVLVSSTDILWENICSRVGSDVERVWTTGQHPLQDHKRLIQREANEFNELSQETKPVFRQLDLSYKISAPLQRHQQV